MNNVCIQFGENSVYLNVDVISWDACVWHLHIWLNVYSDMYPNSWCSLILYEHMCFYIHIFLPFTYLYWALYFCNKSICLNILKCNNVYVINCAVAVVVRVEAHTSGWGFIWHVQITFTWKRIKRDVHRATRHFIKFWNDGKFIRNIFLLVCRKKNMKKLNAVFSNISKTYSVHMTSHHLLLG